MTTKEILKEKIKTEYKNYYVVVGKKGYIDYFTMRLTKKESIKNFLKDSNITWAEAKKYGWECIKVDVNFKLK